MAATKRSVVRGSAVALGLGVLFASSSALADQFVVMDQTWTHTPDLPDSHFHTQPSSSTPADWTSPVDYSQGTAWVYLEVHTKPTDQPTKFQVCFEATPTYACTDQSPTYTTTGTYEWSTPFANFWSPPGESVDWTQGVNQLACILKDTMNNKPSADNVGDVEAALYTPTDVRMVVTIVEPGSTYVPPIPTGEGGAGGTGATASASASAASGSTVSSATSTGAATSSAAGGGGAPAGGDAVDDGCSVRPGRGSSQAGYGLCVGLALALVTSALRSRRRRTP